MKSKKYLDANQVSTVLDISTDCWYKWVKSGKVKDSDLIKENKRVWPEGYIVELAKSNIKNTSVVIPPQYLRRKQIAKELNINPATWAQWVKRGKVKPGVKVHSFLYMWEKAYILELKEKIQSVQDKKNSKRLDVLDQVEISSFDLKFEVEEEDELIDREVDCQILIDRFIDSREDFSSLKKKLSKMKYSISAVSCAGNCLIIIDDVTGSSRKVFYNIDFDPIHMDAMKEV